jgi:23S rRNA pseudouridine1911/1915/1917 synthase
MKFQKITITEENVGQRLDNFLTKKINLSRNQIKRLLESGDIKLNKQAPKKSGQKLKIGDEIAYRLPEAKSPTPKAEDIPLEIIHEDKNILVINKAAGIVVHPDQSGHESGTIVNAVLAHCKDLSGIGGEKRPGIVHRLDKDTSGILLIAKNDKTHTYLSELFKNRQVKKTYTALVKGKPQSKKGRIEAPIKRNSKSRKQMAINPQGKNAITTFEVLESFKKAGQTTSLLKVNIETGRTHQIRLHLASIGHPIACDSKYGENTFNQKFRNTTDLTRQFLHASELQIDGKTFIAPLASDLQITLDSL